jgi:hypothetical protein
VSQHPYNEPFRPGPHDPFATKAGRSAAGGSNSTGVSGFVVSLLSLVCCGLLAPVGIVLSLLGMRQEPRGLATAGLIVGCVSLLLNLIGLGFLALGLGVMGHGSVGSGIELFWDYAMIEAQIQERGSFPASLDELNIPVENTIDPWGNPYEYSVYPDGADYKLESVGPDGQLGTSDDIQLNPS